MKQHNRLTNLSAVLHTTGRFLYTLFPLFLLPMLSAVFEGRMDYALAFFWSAASALIVGFALNKIFKAGKLYFVQSLLVTATAWLALAVFGSLPFFLAGELNFFDSFFETVSGLSTTGLSLLNADPNAPASLIFYKCLMQWAGGLGIITLFLAVTFRSNNAYFQLFAAESHKIDTPRPTPSIAKTIVYLWLLYTGFTATLFVILMVCGLGITDALNHALTTISTGGFSQYADSIGHFRNTGHPNAAVIEWVLIIFMFLGAVNFLIHFLILSGRLKNALADAETRTFLWLLGLAAVILFGDRVINLTKVWSMEGLRTSVFTTVSIMTSTGFTLETFSAETFPPASRLVLIFLMITGGCVGSTAGGLKVLRIRVLFDLFRLQIRRLWMPRKAFSDIVLNDKIFPVFEVKRITGLLVGWLVILLAGAIIISLSSRMNPFSSFSLMATSLGNTGPFFLENVATKDFDIATKIASIFGMLSGRLEILPVFLLFNPRAWKA